MRDNQYTTEGRIRFSEVDHTRRITLPGIVNYFQISDHRPVCFYESIRVSILRSDIIHPVRKE